MHFRSSTQSTPLSSPPAKSGSNNTPGPPERQSHHSTLEKVVNSVTKIFSGDSDIFLDLKDCVPNSDDGKKRLEKYQTASDVLKEAGRIRFLTMGKAIPDGFQGLYDPLGSSCFAQSFTRLEGLSITVASQHAALLLDNLLATLAGIDTLRQLHLDLGYTRTKLAKPSHWAALFQNLSHVKFRAPMTMQECFMLLSYCTRAVTIDLEIPEPEISDSAPRQEEFQAPMLKFSNLRWLKIATSNSVEIILQHIECPKLENLFVMDGLPVGPYFEKTSPVQICKTLTNFLPLCTNLKQLVLAVQCSWRDMKQVPHLSCIETIQELELRAMVAERESCLEDKQSVSVKRGFSNIHMTVCHDCHNGRISHIGQSSRKGVHIGTPLQPIDSDWKLAFWNGKDSLKGLMWHPS